MEESQKKLKEYLPYVQDVFRRLYFIAIFFAVTFVIGFMSAGPAIRLLTQFFNFPGVILASTSPFQIVDLAMNIGLVLAFIVTIPLCLYHFYSFIGSGLRRGEKKLFFFFLPGIFILFFVGFAYSFYVMYFAMETLAQANTRFGIANLWDLGTFLTQIIGTSAVLGLMFEFPVVITMLVRFGVVTVDFLKKKRRYVVFGLILFTSFLPPTDGISLLMMATPLIVMYEGTIVYNVLKYGHSASIIN
jgi:sec-independent protein translocase protein TatC